MLFGLCTNMNAKDEWGVGYEQLPVLAALGFDYAEMPVVQMVAMPEEAFEKYVVKGLRESGIPCLASNNFLPATVRLTGTDANPEAIRSYAVRALDRLAPLGVQTIVLGSAGARNLPAGFSVAEGYEQMCRALDVIAPLAAQRGIVISLEPLNRLESNLLNEYETGLWLAQKSGQPNVGCLVDAYHLRVGNGHLEGLIQCAPSHVHYARTLGRRLPEAPEMEDKIFFAALKAAGYEKLISLEGYAPEGLAEAAGKALAVLRALAA